MSADMGQFDARKTTPSSKDAQNQVFAKFEQKKIDAAFDAVTAAINKATYTEEQAAKVEPRNRGQMALEGI